MDSANRLRRHADYQLLYKSGRKHFAKHMSYFVSSRCGAEGEGVRASACGPRVGLTVGRVLGGAVERNRIKRRLRAAVRKHIAILHGLDVDIALHPRKAVLELEWKTLDAEIAGVFRAVAKIAG